MIRTEHESSVDAKKSYTRYKWTLNDWRLLWNHHYSKGTSSPKFFLSNTGCECSMTLHNHGEGGRLTINHEEEIDGLLMDIDVFFLDTSMIRLHSINKGFAKPFPKEFTIDLGVQLKKDLSGLYLAHKALMLLIEFTIVESVGNSKLQSQNFNGNSTINALDNLPQLLNSKSFCDITFVIGEKEFVAHKVILAANSEVFCAMFDTKMKEKEKNIVEIDDIDATVFEEFLNYMYSGKVNNLPNIVADLIIVANKYLMYDLKQMCSNYMNAHIDIKNAIRYLLVFHKLDCVGPKTKALNFIKANPRVLAVTADYKILCDYPELIKEAFGH